MRTFTDSAYQQPAATGNQAYSASVPLSVYRELAAELQATQAAIHQLNQQNEDIYCIIWNLKIYVTLSVGSETPFNYVVIFINVKNWGS